MALLLAGLATRSAGVRVLHELLARNVGDGGLRQLFLALGEFLHAHRTLSLETLDVRLELIGDVGIEVHESPPRPACLVDDPGGLVADDDDLDATEPENPELLGVTSGVPATDLGTLIRGIGLFETLESFNEALETLDLSQDLHLDESLCVLRYHGHSPCLCGGMPQELTMYLLPYIEIFVKHSYAGRFYGICYYGGTMNNDWRKKYLFDPKSTEPFKISRSKIDLFIQCPHCFYLGERLGVKRPSMPAFSLNVAVDELLKKEFDAHRAAGTAHPLMKRYKIDAVPYPHKDLEAWRDSLKRGISYHHKPSNLFVRGGVDDVWVHKNGELIIVDYKATSKKDTPTIEGGWGDQYKRQMEIYQWLFAQNGFSVSPTGYFVYCNGKKDKEAFDGKLEFDIIVIPYKGKTNWVEETLVHIHMCLMGDMPEKSELCEYCAYRIAADREEHVTLKQKGLF